MKTKTGYHFYTELAPNGEWVGRCKEIPSVAYQRPNRDTALSGIRRTVESMSKNGTLPGGNVPTAQTTVATASQHTATLVKPKLNRVAFVIDRSGSMSPVYRHALAALHSNIQTLRDQEKLTGQKTLVTVITFDDRIDVIRLDTPLSILREVTDREIMPRNQTALWDAVDVAIKTFEAIPEETDYDVSYLIITLTDGAENASGTTRYTLSSSMKKHQMSDRWTFAFLVPPGHSHMITNALGAPGGNVSEWEATQKGVETYKTQTNDALRGYYTARSAGHGATQTFYTDLSNVTSAQIKSNFVDVRTNVAIWPVTKTADIRTLCESKGAMPYEKGAAFYQLTKTEEVQAYKKLVIIDRTSGSVYSGAANSMRNLLGIPSSKGTIKLAPGNNGNFDVFVQSTSVNRKVYAGSKIVYYPGAVSK
jgi:uncharacterized protein YegL